MNINEIKDFVEGKLIMCGYEIRNGDLDIEEMEEVFNKMVLDVMEMFIEYNK